jgi:hypothetical protein
MPTRFLKQPTRKASLLAWSALSPYLTIVLTPLATAVRSAEVRIGSEKSMPAPRARKRRCQCEARRC